MLGKNTVWATLCMGNQECRGFALVLEGKFCRTLNLWKYQEKVCIRTFIPIGTPHVCLAELNHLVWSALSKFVRSMPSWQEFERSDWDMNAVQGIHSTCWPAHCVLKERKGRQRERAETQGRVVCCCCLFFKFYLVAHIFVLLLGKVFVNKNLEMREWIKGLRSKISTSDFFFWIVSVNRWLCTYAAMLTVLIYRNL